MMAAYYSAELEVQAEAPGLPYRRVLSSSLERAFARCGLELPAGEEDALVRAWGSMPVFTDVGDALGRLRLDGWTGRPWSVSRMPSSYAPPCSVCRRSGT